MADEPKAWQELPIGGLIVDAGNAIEYNTGNWRAFRPIVDMEKCTHCMFCWLFCPDVSIIVEDQKMIGIDYDHCKGCAVCADVCPPKCITMHPESEFEGEEV
jgi:2-oxoacid:acceptor oxidoreductase delta subunit (pyruvate/2-ketoisovalerate family)